MRSLACLSLLLLVGCVADVGDEPIDESVDELSSKTYDYKCTVLDQGGWEPVEYLRVTATKTIWNQKSSFTGKAGAQTALRDKTYKPKGSVQYQRYRYDVQWKNESTGKMYTVGEGEWKLEPEMLTGGKKMKSGDLGGFAIHGARVDWYGSAKYVCFRD